ncbi:MAG: DUF4123 domain-containing protein [Comamonas sp.]
MTESEITAFAAFLRARDSQLYMLIDAACNHASICQLRAKGLDVRSLFSGIKEITLAEVAPYLMSLPQEPKLLGSLIEQYWGYGKCWSVVVEGFINIEQLRIQLKKSLNVELENGSSAYFRFYDSRALGKFVGISSMKQMDELFGDSIQAFHYASSDISTSLMCLRKINEHGWRAFMNRDHYKLTSCSRAKDIYVENIKQTT